MAFEEDLKRSLRREPAPADFAAKVLARTAALQPAKPKVVVLPIWRRTATWSIAAGLAVAALIPPTIGEYHHKQEQKAAEAGRQLLLALDITRTQLQKTRTRIQKISRNHAL